MNVLLDALYSAIFLIVTLDPDLVSITTRTFFITLSAVVLGSVIGMPLGAVLAVSRFPYRRVVIALVNALMGLPPVVVGLFLYILLSRHGPFGVFNLLYTPGAMIIAQTLIITPIIASVSHQALRDLWAEYHDLLISLNATKVQRVQTLLWDARRSLVTAGLAGFGRGIGEVGAIMIVGGNIDQVTRVLTTAIALETSKGNFPLALGLGFILIGAAIATNLLVHTISGTERGKRW